VPEHDRVVNLHIPDEAIRKIMQVGTADPDRPYLHHHLPGPGFRRGCLNDAKRAPLVEFSDAHHFLKRLSKAARASFGFRTTGVLAALVEADPLGAPSRITVTRGLNSSHSFG
jgi:hypothetical protein